MRMNWRRLVNDNYSFPLATIIICQQLRVKFFISSSVLQGYSFGGGPSGGTESLAPPGAKDGVEPEGPPDGLLWSFPPPLPFWAPTASAFNLKDHGVMPQPVDSRHRRHWVLED